MDTPTIIYEDNVTCIAQIKGGYIKGYRTQHITITFFHTTQNCCLLLSIKVPRYNITQWVRGQTIEDLKSRSQLLNKEN